MCKTANEMIKKAISEYETSQYETSKHETPKKYSIKIVSPFKLIKYDMDYAGNWPSRISKDIAKKKGYEDFVIKGNKFGGVYFLWLNNHLGFIGQSKNVLNCIALKKYKSKMNWNKFSVLRYDDYYECSVARWLYVSIFKPCYNKENSGEKELFLNINLNKKIEEINIERKDLKLIDENDGKKFGDKEKIIICSKCKNIINSKANFCIYCGSKIKL